jgi:hypothetical protein
MKWYRLLGLDEKTGTCHILKFWSYKPNELEKEDRITHCVVHGYRTFFLVEEIEHWQFECKGPYIKRILHTVTGE